MYDVVCWFRIHDEDVACPDLLLTCLIVRRLLDRVFFVCGFGAGSRNVVA